MHWRAAKRSPLIVDSRVVAGIDDVFGAIDRHQEDGDWWESRKLHLRECIQKLSKPLMEAIQQVYLKEKSLEEAATFLDSSRLAMGKRVSRARHEIRICIKQKLQTDNASF